MTDNHKNNNDNLFVPAILAMLFVLAAAAAVWVTQVRPSTAEQLVVVSTAVDTTPAEKAANLAPTAPAEVEAASAQPAKGDPAAGQALFASCAACHGPTGEGIPGLGKDLTNSEFVSGKTDGELISFIKVGRDPSDPLNTTGIAMPPKGGNPALSDEDLFNIVAYLRSIHK